MYKSSFAIVVGMMTLGAGCGGDGGGSYSAADILDQMPEGAIEGADWTMVEAVVEAGDTATDDLSVTLLAEDVEACGFGLQGDVVLFSIPRAVGEYPLHFDFSEDSQTVTFYSEATNNNVIASNGLVVVEGVSDTEVTIGLAADAGDSTVNGRFTATICESPF